MFFFFFWVFFVAKRCEARRPVITLPICYSIEILTIAIRSHSNIRDIKVGEDETKVLTYADDMTADRPHLGVG